MGSNNPFLSLFGGTAPKDVAEIREQVETRLSVCQESKDKLNATESTDPFKKLVEDILLFSLDKDNKKCLYLEDFVSCMLPGQKLDQEILEQALFDRLMMQDMPESAPPTEGAFEKRLVPYLLGCYKRAKEISKKTDQKEAVLPILKLIVLNVVTAVKEPDIYEGQNFPEQMYEILKDSSCDYLGAFLQDVAGKFKEDENGIESLCKAFFPVLDIVKNRLKKEGSLANIHSDSLFIVRLFATDQGLAEVLLRHSTPGEQKNGKEFENTLLGLFLSFSCIPKTDLGPFEFFDKPSSQPSSVHSAIEGHIWTALNFLRGAVYELFYTLLKTNKELVLEWFGKCLEKNIGRGKLWNNQMQIFAEPTAVSDGFMLNLAASLLKLSEPVVTSCEKLLKVDPKYTSANTSVPIEAFKQGVHLVGLEKETCFVPKPDDFSPSTDVKFGLSSDLFFLTHKALDLSTRLAHEKLVQLSQELNKLQRAWQELQSAGAMNSQQGLEIKDRMNMRMSVYLSVRAALAEPKFSQNCMNFLIGSAKWACEVGTNCRGQWESVTSLNDLPIGDNLMFVPEFVATNICDFVLFLKRFHAVILEDCKDDLGYIFDFILIFMGSKHRMKNPHLRAKLAELCESLVPLAEDGSVVASSFYREKLFKEYKHRKLLVATLLNVFVSIEMTGEGVAFEQKFNYRRPMYVLMKHLWSLKDHRQQFKNLADEAEKNLEATDPPLFLRFLNLLMNDAVYLLDEALSYMSQIREQQTERNTGDWPNVPANQRPQREGMFQHMTMLARFHNHLGLATISVLSMMTSTIKTIFYQPMLVERIASMLNYFLLNLVGPKNRNFKAKDFEKYEFQPAEVVTHICHVYVNLGQNSQFCAAVSADGRSYSPQLFEQAGNVLRKIGKYDLLAELEEIAQRVKNAAVQQKTDDEIASLAPEEYLDPIMSAVMSDPVMLPSSKIIVDRSTIARHLLSDQSDPFNRAPLTLDQVIPCPELKKTIQDWLEVQRNTK